MINANKIFGISKEGFEELALDIFRMQYRQVPVYREFSDKTGRPPEKVNSIEKIPFLPVSFFKQFEIKSPERPATLLFKSSGTTGMKVSRHFVIEPEIYQRSFLHAFQLFYGQPSAYCILGLLPSYLEQGSSSLVYMVDELIKQSNHPLSGFYLYDHDLLYNTLQYNEENRQPTLLIGVTYALLDFFEKHKVNLKYTTIIETGGMKGRRKELTRYEVHAELKSATGLSCIHSEYGMTELLSQAWSGGDGIFKCPPWMKVGIRAEDDPFEVFFVPPCHSSKNGVVNIIDLANIHSCSFIAIDDLARLNQDGSFEILGRLDAADVRGCSLLYM